LFEKIISLVASWYKKERLAKMDAVYAVQLDIDDIVMDAYGISKVEWKEMIKLGVPWARGGST